MRFRAHHELRGHGLELSGESLEPSGLYLKLMGQPWVLKVLRGRHQGEVEVNRHLDQCGSGPILNYEVMALSSQAQALSSQACISSSWVSPES